MSDTINADQNPGTSAPETQDSTPLIPGLVEEEHSHLGPIIGVLIVVLVLILGGLYLWGQSLMNGPAGSEQIIPRSIQNNEPETPRAEADADILGTVSSSDELDAIDADLESTLLDSLDTELDEIDRELDATLFSI
jgi:hypothetical protein